MLDVLSWIFAYAALLESIIGLCNKLKYGVKELESRTKLVEWSLNTVG
jgi:hypothetical protein